MTMDTLSPKQYDTFCTVLRGALAEVGVNVTVMCPSGMCVDQFKLAPRQVWRAYELAFVAAGVRKHIDFETFVDNCKAMGHPETLQWFARYGL